MTNQESSSSLNDVGMNQTSASAPVPKSPVLKSNPLAAVDNTDVRLQYFDLDGSSDRYDLWTDGAYMLTPKLKLKYELHEGYTELTGSRESGFETVHLKPIYFPTQGEWETSAKIGPAKMIIEPMRWIGPILRTSSVRAFSGR